ncbi:MAG: ABC-F family ATP-binding cassette domain-containing protein, partial [Saprospiraceae bacterium]|nr:ABC-F family ATP-binding cassette domain-containing protein [Saprospiraceae bacterium]
QTVEALDTLQAWDFEAKIKEILSRLKIDLFLTQRVNTLSGGQKKRLALAMLLIDEPDFMILDEPTNHLDLDMIEWLEAYFSSKPSLTIFMVTHDRYFLDAVCNRVIELDGGKFYPYKGNYAYYLEQKALRANVEAATMAKNQNYIPASLIGCAVSLKRGQPKRRVV